MNNTTSNIRNEYTSLSTQGNLHDFTASELYEIGNPSYSPDGTNGIIYTYNAALDYSFTSCIYGETGSPAVDINNIYNSKSGLPTERGTYYYAVPDIQKYEGTDGVTYVRTYHLLLNPSFSTGLYKTFAEQNPTSSYVVFNYSVTQFYETGETPSQKLVNLYEITHDASGQIIPWSEISPEDLATLANENLFGDDYQDLAQFLNEHSQNVFSLITTTNTPLANYIDKNYSSEVDYRFFKSINVTATKDNIFYKIIDSNPEDEIDTMVLFKDRNNRYGNQLFSETDCTPWDSTVSFRDFDGNKIAAGTEYTLDDATELKLKVPSTFAEVCQIPLYTQEEIRQWKGKDWRLGVMVYGQIIKLRFKRMLAADISTNKLNDILYELAGFDQTNESYIANIMNLSTNLAKAYISYLEDWYHGGYESLTISANGNIVFSWIELTGTPQTCTISNWTSRFSIVNPQHLEKNNKFVIDPSQLNNFAPYKAWCAAHSYSSVGELNQRAVKNFFNTLTADQFGFWINPYTKDSWDQMTYYIDGIDNPLTIRRGEGSTQWNGVDDKYIVDCGGFKQIIWGCGLTPDFMYPVVDISRPTPNTKTECLVYCNNAGYAGIKLAFINSQTEDYLVAAFKKNVNTTRQREILKAINGWAEDHMIFPDNVKCAYFADDSNNMLNCSGFRVSYIPGLIKVIDIVSVVLCSFIGILCLVICFVIIKRYVENNRVNIGIMRANGIKKWKIGLSLLPFALFPAVIGGVSAYFVGLFLQAPALLLFKNYWMLPTPLIKFSWLPLLICVFAPFLIFSAICFITTLIVLRVKTVELMRPGSEFKANAFSRIAKKPFKHFGVLTRFRVALAFNSISRLLMLAAMSCLTMSSLVFAFTTFDKLNQSRMTNSTQFDYSFNLDLTTPTSTGGPYGVFDYSAYWENAQGENMGPRGFGFSDPSQYIFNTNYDTNSLDPSVDWATVQGETGYSQLTKWYSCTGLFEETLDPGYRAAIGKNGNLVFPTQADMIGKDEDLMYLQNKTSPRLLLDYNIGLSELGITSNPWEIALSLMPANSRNIAADAYNAIINEVGKLVDEQQTKFWNNDELTNSGFIKSQSYPDCYYIRGPSTEQINLIHKITDEYGKWFSLVYDDSLTSDVVYWYNSYNRFFTKHETESGEATYTLNSDMGTVGHLFSSFKTQYIKLLRTIYTEPRLMQMEYPISYGVLPLNWSVDASKKDETYTYITANIKSLSNGHKFDDSDELKIEGIKSDSQFIKLTDKKGNNLNKWLFDVNYLNELGINEDVNPLIANAYAAHKYGLKKGDSITITASNMAQRFEYKINSKNFEEGWNEATFKIVGISEGTNGSAFYTTQELANRILGLPDGSSWNKTHRYMMWYPYADYEAGRQPHLADLAGPASNNGNIDIWIMTGNQPVQDPEPVAKLSKVAVPVGFNGIYTENKEGKPITAGLSLYSYTGMYPGASVYKSNGTNQFTTVLSKGVNLSIANMMTGIADPAVYETNAKYLNGEIDEKDYRNFIEENFIPAVVDAYGETTMITAIVGAMDVAASDLIYSNLISTFDLAETTIMSIIIPITIIIVAIISNLIINDSKKMAAMLKALGYSDAKNLMSILALFVPSIALGLLLAIPLSLGLTLGYQSIIFTSANILVDVTQKWWYYVAAVGGIGLILLATYAIGYAAIKRDRLIDQIK